MKKFKELSKSKKILITILVIIAIIVFIDGLIPLILMAISGIGFIKARKDKKRLKKFVYGICLALCTFVAIAVYSVPTDTTDTKVSGETLVESKEDTQTSDETLAEPEEDIQDTSETLAEPEEDIQDTSETLAKPEEDIQDTNETLVESKKDITEEMKDIAYYVISSELGDPITNTKLDSLNVNENLGTDSEEDVIVLANLSWSTKNLEKMTREMLEMYSNHLAAKLAPKLADGSEIALFWYAEYTGLNIKHSYYVKNGNAYIQD